MRGLLAGAAVTAAVVAVMPAVSGQAQGQAAQGRGARPPAISGGNGTMYIGTYKGEIEIYDEATEKMVDKITLKTGKAVLVMKKDGSISINGKDISIDGSGKIDIKAKGNITQKGQKILQN